MASRPRGLSRPSSAVPVTSTSAETPAENLVQQNLQWIEGSVASEEIKEAMLMLLENRPDDPLLFLSAFFNDRACCRSNVSQAFWYVCADCATEAQFMDNLTSAYSVLDDSSGGTGVWGSQFHKLLRKMIGPDWPRTIECVIKVAGQRKDTYVTFRDFQFGVQVGLMVRQLQQRTLQASQEAFHEQPEGSARLPRYMFLQVTNQLQSMLPPELKSWTALATRLTHASEAILDSQTFEVDEFVSGLLTVIASALAPGGTS